MVTFGIDGETYQFWKANAGNAKARRRWRRRDIPNAQRVDAQHKAEWIAELDAKAEHFGAWTNGSTWAPGIWGGVASPVNAGVKLTLGDHSVDSLATPTPIDLRMDGPRIGLKEGGL